MQLIKPVIYKKNTIPFKLRELTSDITGSTTILKRFPNYVWVSLLKRETLIPIYESLGLI